MNKKKNRLVLSFMVHANNTIGIYQPFVYDSMFFMRNAVRSQVGKNGLGCL